MNQMFSPCSILQKSRNYLPNGKWLYGLLLVFLFSVTNKTTAQINDDGLSHSVSYNGTYQDFVLPNNAAITRISFTLKGGDGGRARVEDTFIDPDPFGGCFLCLTEYVVIAEGGEGATATVIFNVGAGAGQIPLGSTIRFVVGGGGQNGSSGGAAGVGLDYGGGGGGTAVLYKAPSASTFTLLGVAGGGGGAYQGMFAYSSVDKEDGQGGRSGTSGGNGNGDLGAGDGGVGGQGGESNPLLGSFGGGGGGASTPGGGVNCVSLDTDLNPSEAGEGGPGLQAGGYGGDNDNCVNFSWRNGGFGYGGGGAGSGAGGGGGGYSGGGVGGTTGRGGGGGSFLASFRQSGSVSAGGSVFVPQHGSASYQVELNQPPVALCKNATIYLTSSGTASLSATAVDNGSSDPDGSIANLSVSPNSFDCSNTGANNVILTVTDNDGTTATCTAVVTVVDAILPTILTKPATVYLDANGMASIVPADVDNGSYDNCDITLSLNQTSFDCNQTGTNTVTLTGTDPSGNMRSASATVTVVDNIVPTMLTKDITIYLDANGMASIAPADVDNNSYDNCGITLSLDKTDFDCSETGANTVTLKGVDPSGNMNTATATVTVVDNIVPTMFTNDITVYLDANGMVSIAPADVNNNSYDNCGITLSLDKMDFDCSETGANTVTLKGVDPSGNMNTATAIVTVVDNIPPTMLTKDITIYLDANGEASIVPADVDNGSFDNCDITLSLDKMDFDCSETGANTVTLKGVDPSGNMNTATATVTVVDNIPPTMLTKDITIYLDANGEASIVTADVDNGSYDNCDITLSLDKMDFDCSETGANTVTLKGVDPSGNMNTATATVTVVDNIPPTIVSVTSNPSTLWSPNHKMEDVVVSIESFDNCEGHTCKVISISSDEPLNDIGDGNTEVDYVITGDNTVQLRAERNGKGIGRVYTITVECTDASGNTTQATCVVTVSHDQSMTTTIAKQVETNAATLSLQVINNPSNTGQPFKLRILSSDKQTPVQLRVLDAAGRPVETRKGLNPEQVISIGAQFKAGMYIAEATQNGKRATIKLLKL